MSELRTAQPGVYACQADGTLKLIHQFNGGEYRMFDVLEYFELGEVILDESNGSPMPDPGALSGLELDRKELGRLKSMAEAYGEDHPPEFAEMCRDMYRAALSLPGDEVCYYANF